MDEDFRDAQDQAADEMADIKAGVSAALAVEREEVLRDSFACGAMSALIARGDRRGHYDIADLAYSQADAMMKRRKVKPNFMG